MTFEIWRDVTEFPGVYEVSSFGRVRSLLRRGHYAPRLRAEPLIMKPAKNKNTNVVCVTLSNRSKPVCRSVHRLVLLAFVGPCPEGMEGCHNDGNNQNNHLSNLRWDTHRNNMMVDAVKHGTFRSAVSPRGEENGRAVLTEADVRRIRAQKNYRGVNVDLGKEYGLLATSIRNIRDGLTWKHVT